LVNADTGEKEGYEGIIIRLILSTVLVNSSVIVELKTEVSVIGCFGSQAGKKIILQNPLYNF
jgi:hypothetical protein